MTRSTTDIVVEMQRNGSETDQARFDGKEGVAV